MKKKTNEKVDLLQRCIDSLKQNAQETAPFFIPWFKALLLISQRDFTKEKNEDKNLLEAVRLFDVAFENKYLAGDFIKDFLKQGFVLGNYINSSFNLIIRAYKYDGINEKQKNPITRNAKKFLNFGYAIDLFSRDVEFEYLKALSANELFNKVFPPCFFVNEEDARKHYQNECKNNEPIEIEDVKHLYNILSLLSPSKRNNRICIPEAISKKLKSNSKQKPLFPPLNLCLRYSLQDERLLDLALDWLEDNKNPIDTTIVSYTGQTALCEAFLIYKKFSLNIPTEKNLKAFCKEVLNAKDEDISSIIKKNLEKKEIKDYKWKENLEKSRIYEEKITKIIEMLSTKTDFESELQFSEKIPTLTYAIDAFNLEFVQKLLKKIPEEKLQDYQLAENISPLMYAIYRKCPVSLGFEEFIRRKKDVNSLHLVYSPGLSFTRKELEAEVDYPRLNDSDKYWYHHDQKEREISDVDYKWYSENYGDPEAVIVHPLQIKELDRIIDYFISKTQDIDSFKASFRSSDNDVLRYTSLIYAAIHNDVETCRKLLKLKALDYSEEYGFYSCKYGEIKFYVQNNLVNNLCLFKSWETLVMIFDEYPELIKKSLCCTDQFVNSFELFAVVIKERFVWSRREKEEYRHIAEYLLNRFIECEADLEKRSRIGSVKTILDGTGLLD